MTVEDQIRYLQSKIASLEARLASSQSQTDNPTTEGRLLGTQQQAVDPKGRKIWESEWRGDYNVMMAWVPDNALIIDGENVEVEADDKENDEVTLSDGSWYLHAYKNKTTGSWEAELDQEPFGTREDETAKYDIHICDIHQDGYVEKQFVVGSIVLGGNDIAFMGDANGSEPTDGRSIDEGDLDGLVVIQGASLKSEDEPELSLPVSGLQFLTVPPSHDGSAAGELSHVVLDVIDREDVCEDGAWAARTMTYTPKEGSAKTIHFLGCDDIDIDLSDSGGGADSVVGSEYIDVDDDQEEDEETGETRDVRRVKAKTDTPDNVPSKDDDKHALLTNDSDQLVRCAKTFLGTQHPNGSDKIVIDGQEAKITAKSLDDFHSAEINAHDGVVTLTDTSGNKSKSIILNPSSIPDSPDCGGTISVHSFKYKDKSGNTHTHHGLFCSDIDLTNNGKLIKSTEVSASADPGGTTTITFTYTDDTYDTISIANGLNGNDGSPGDPGDTPEITSDGDGFHTFIYADGNLIATLQDGHTPQITADQKVNGITVIRSDGVAIASIADGISGSGTVDFIHDVKYDTSDHSFKKLTGHLDLSTGKVTYGSNNAESASAGTWATVFTTTPLSGEE